MYAEGLPVIAGAQQRWGTDPALVLTPGRLYYVAVLAKEGDGRALVSLGGHRFTAQVLGGLPEQGRVAVTVREATPERVVLERAPEVPSGSSREAPTDPVERLLQRIGLPSRSDLREALPHLMRSGQPLTAENVASLLEAWGRLAPGRPEALSTLARLQAQGLPLLPETLEAAARLQGDRPLLTAGGLFRLSQSLIELARALDTHPSRTGPESLPAFARALGRTLASLPLLTAGHPAVARQVSSLLRDLGTPVEATLARLGSSRAALPALPTPQASDPGPGGPPPAGEQGPSETPAAEVLLRNPGSARSGVPAVEENVQVQLRRLDALLDRLIGHPERLSPESREAVLHCKEAVQTVLGDLEAEHIGNLRSGAESAFSHSLSFSLPIAWSGTQDQASLRVHCRRERGPALDPQNAHLAFRLTVAPLGTVEIDLRVLRQAASCEVRTEDDSVRRVAERAAPQLREGLQRLGYLVSGVRCAIGTPTRPTEMEPAAISPEELALVDMVG